MEIAKNRELWTSRKRIGGESNGIFKGIYSYVAKRRENGSENQCEPDKYKSNS
jgi:hypothetical protein